ncbi:cobyrinate a,c-diamide synthase [Skermania piniformis]|uniref:cobyrinate a,c-diamide synthase n=1 Tax=Skermania pinensis TaxID=39122 RepID=UPI001FEA4470|nr:cobyrinate a,c-diamide synthase [Skermania piniformis]
MSARALVLAAPASGSGKTTVATGLIGALRRNGHAVAPFKVGPDYIDPGYHAVAAGRPGRNLDPVLVGSDRIGPLFRHGATGCDLAVVEGVMGLFDGRIDGGEHLDRSGTAAAVGSTAQVAALLGAPVVLVVDARGHSQSLAALLHGFATYDPAVRLAGVILNRVGSDRHEQVLRAACARVGLPVLGAVPRLAELVVPSRHLGLIPAVEHGGAAVAAVATMTELVARHVDLTAVAALAMPVVAGPAWDPVAEVGGSTGAAVGRPVVAIAGGPAFTFGYAEHRELLRAAGAEVVTVDPLREQLPDQVAGLVLPGGFPEAHAAQLAANRRLRGQVAELAERGLPVHAECAGLLYLARTLDAHPMCGVVDADAVFGEQLTLGYRDAVALTDSVLWPAGARVTGHEFHRTRLTEPGGRAWGWSIGTRRSTEGFVRGRTHASYLHTHPAGNPAAVREFTRAAASYAGFGS